MTASKEPQKTQRPAEPKLSPASPDRTLAAPRSQAASGIAKGASTASEIADFVAKVKALEPQPVNAQGRLLFAIDATMSRQPTWDMALALQGDMFRAVDEIGGLSVQLGYFRGFDECRVSKWVSDPQSLARLMASVACRGGHTQIGKILSHARAECAKSPVHALVYVGDCVEEAIDDLCQQAGQLALLGLPVFLFQEGRDANAARAFREIARLTRGASCAFDAGSADQLRALLTAVATYAAGGRRALLALAQSKSGAAAQLLLTQINQ